LRSTRTVGLSVQLSPPTHVNVASSKRCTVAAGWVTGAAGPALSGICAVQAS
jgi:hypothetical protein